MKPILDPMSGSRMFYFDKNNASVLFGDIRDESYWLSDYSKLVIHPDQQLDARELPFADNSFHLVVLDPPHLYNCGKNSDLGKSYGVLNKATWETDLKQIFDEAWRVLKPNSTLIFKWADKDITLNHLLYVLGREPVFGDKKISGRKLDTHRFWLVFFKEELKNAS